MVSSPQALLDVAARVYAQSSDLPPCSLEVLLDIARLNVSPCLSAERLRRYVDGDLSLDLVCDMD